MKLPDDFLAKNTVPRDTADSFASSQLLVCKGNYSTATKRIQLPILGINFAIENKTQTQQAKDSVTGAFCSNLGLGTAEISFKFF